MSESNGRGWRIWIGPAISFVVLSLLVVGAVIAVDVYHWKPSQFGWIVVALLALGFTKFATVVESISLLGWIVIFTGSVLWVKIAETREVLAKQLGEIQDSLSEIRGKQFR